MSAYYVNGPNQGKTRERKTLSVTIVCDIHAHRISKEKKHPDVARPPFPCFRPSGTLHLRGLVDAKPRRLRNNSPGANDPSETSSMECKQCGGIQCCLHLALFLLLTNVKDLYGRLDRKVYRAGPHCHGVKQQTRAMSLDGFLYIVYIAYNQTTQPPWVLMLYRQ